MSRYRFFAIGISIIYAIIFDYGMNRVCDEFSGVIGYSLCVIPDVSYRIIFFTLAISPSFFMPITNKPSSFILWSVYFMHIFGSVYSLPFYNIYNKDIFLFSLFIIITYIMVCLTVNISFTKLNFNAIFNDRLILYILISINIASIIYTLSRFGINLSLPSIDDVYGTRREFAQKLSDSHDSLSGYIFSMSGFATSPLGVIVSILFYNRNKILSISNIIICMILSLMIYQNAAFKGVAFLFVFSVVVYLFLRQGRNEFISSLKIYSIIFLFSFTVDVFEWSDTVFVHWFRRVFIVPGMHTSLYFQLFDLDIIWRENYAQSVSNFIYYTDGSSNSGLYGAGLARGGWLGVLINLAIFSIFLNFVRIYSSNIPKHATMAICFSMVYVFSNSATTTVLLSYGGFIICIFIYMLDSVYIKNAPRGGEKLKVI